jgi:hypothetical protein
MSAAYIHLMLNHFSIVGSIFGLALLAVAIARRSRELTMVTFAFLVAIALISIAVYFTGAPARHQIEHLPGVTRDAIDRHAKAADFGLTAISCLGTLALAGLWLFRREPIPRWFLGVMLVGSLLTVGAMLYTAGKGRDIRHPEVGATSFSSEYSMTASRRPRSAWPAAESDPHDRPCARDFG